MRIFNILTSKLNYMLYWQFHFKNEISINHLFTQWKWMYIYIYICWILNLEGEVHSTWDLWISGLQESKGNGFFEVRHGGQKFLVRSKNSRFFISGGCPCPYLPSLVLSNILIHFYFTLGLAMWSCFLLLVSKKSDHMHKTQSYIKVSFFFFLNSMTF